LTLIFTAASFLISSLRGGGDCYTFSGGAQVTAAISSFNSSATLVSLLRFKPTIAIAASFAAAYAFADYESIAVAAAVAMLYFDEIAVSGDLD